MGLATSSAAAPSTDTGGAHGGGGSGAGASAVPSAPPAYPTVSLLAQASVADVRAWLEAGHLEQAVAAMRGGVDDDACPLASPTSRMGYTYILFARVWGGGEEGAVVLRTRACGSGASIFFSEPKLSKRTSREVAPHFSAASRVHTFTVPVLHVL